VSIDGQSCFLLSAFDFSFFSVYDDFLVVNQEKVAPNFNAVVHVWRGSASAQCEFVVLAGNRQQYWNKQLRCVFVVVH
jgi:hypothetical protein